MANQTFQENGRLPINRSVSGDPIFLVALESAVDFLQMVGIRNVEARMRALAGRAQAGLRNLPNVQVKTNPEAELSAGVVKFLVKNVPV